MDDNSGSQSQNQYGQSVRPVFSNQAAGPWTETVGRLKEVSDESITLEVSHIICASKEDLAKLKHRLVKGSYVGILVLDNGSIRVRQIPDGEEEGSSTGPEAEASTAGLSKKGKMSRIFD